MRAGTDRGFFSAATILIYLKSPEMNRSKGKGGVVGKDFSILIPLEIIFPINIICIAFHNNTYFNYSKIFWVLDNIFYKTINQ